jgi:transcriptional regulator
MYIPHYFRNNNIAEVKDFIKQNSFAILINNSGNQIHATHIPLVLGQDDKGNDTLTGHISRANPQLKNFKENSEVLVIFNGPHTYISSSWYDHENVPTWNYIAVHITGKLKIIEGEKLMSSLKSLENKYEANSEQPVSVEKISPKLLEENLRGIIGFEIAITDIQAAYKLSQNRDEKNKAAIINQLEKGDNDARAVAEKMKKR